MSQQPQTPYIGCKISLISMLDIRYEGILYSVNSEKSTIGLSKVRFFGTEERLTVHAVPAHNEVYEYIIFKATDVKDLVVCTSDGLDYNPVISAPKDVKTCNAANAAAPAPATLSTCATQGGFGQNLEDVELTQMPRAQRKASVTRPFTPISNLTFNVVILFRPNNSTVLSMPDIVTAEDVENTLCNVHVPEPFDIIPYDVGEETFSRVVLLRCATLEAAIDAAHSLHLYNTGPMFDVCMSAKAMYVTPDGTPSWQLFSTSYVYSAENMAQLPPPYQRDLDDGIWRYRRTLAISNVHQNTTVEDVLTFMHMHGYREHVDLRHVTRGRDGKGTFYVVLPFAAMMQTAIAKLSNLYFTGRLAVVVRPAAKHGSHGEKAQGDVLHA